MMPAHITVYLTAIVKKDEKKNKPNETLVHIMLTLLRFSYVKLVVDHESVKNINEIY